MLSLLGTTWDDDDYHRNAYGRDGEMEMITTGPVGKPLGRDPSGFRIVKVGDGALEHEYFGLRTS